jgi:hypothetical protein
VAAMTLAWTAATWAEGQIAPLPPGASNNGNTQAPKVTAEGVLPPQATTRPVATGPGAAVAPRGPVLPIQSAGAGVGPLPGNPLPPGAQAVATGVLYPVPPTVPVNNAPTGVVSVPAIIPPAGTVPITPGPDALPPGSTTQPDITTPAGAGEVPANGDVPGGAANNTVPPAT